MIKHSNYKDNIFVKIGKMNIDDVPKIILIKGNKLATKIN